MELFNELKKKNILLIDDDEWVRDSLYLFFESEGCYLTALETAEEGLNALGKQDYDIIISDFKLPGMDGVEFFRRVKEKTSNAIKILITAYGSEEVVAEASKAGVQDFIEKPFSSDIIEGSLSALIQTYRHKN